MMIYNVAEYGICGDGITNHTNGLNALIEKASVAGGILFFPPGEYVTGTLFLRSNITLQLAKGAIILGSEDFEDYPLIDPQTVQGYTRGGHWGLLSALDAENIRVIGEGTVDARGQGWWRSGKDDLVRPRTVSFILCRNVEIRDVTFRNAPCWTVHPMCCQNVLIDSVQIFNPYHSPNTDGINPESSKNVIIRNCFLDVGDDCIAIKSGTEDDLLQKQYPSENITVENCTMAHGHGGVVIGSEMSGSVKNVTVRNCVFKDTDRGIRIKTRRMRGGSVEGITVENITMENPLACLTFNTYYYYGAPTEQREVLFDKHAQEVTKLTPVIRDVNIRRIYATGVKGVGIYMLGLPEMPVKNVTMENLNFEITGNEAGISAVSALDRERSKGEGISLENVENVVMNDVQISCSREMYVLNHVKNVMINGVEYE